MRSEMYVSMGMFHEAILDLDSANELTPTLKDQTMYLVNRATCYGGMHRHDLALADYNAAIKSNSDDAQLFFRRSLVHCIRGEFALALGDLNHTINVFSCDRFLDYFTRGAVSMSLAMEAESIDVIQPTNPFAPSAVFEMSTTKLDPMYGLLAHGSYRSKVAYKLAYRALENFNFAIKLFRAAVDGDYQHALYREYGLSWFALGKYTKAVDSFKLALSLAPSNEDAAEISLYRAMASKCERKPDFERIMDDINKAIELNEDARAYYTRAEMFLDIGSVNKAIADLNTVIALKGNDTTKEGSRISCAGRQ
ncbi:Aste57867_15577 [Aphanomyces stellatus]|uniref:Aste57867_15577 protein n=1 Tax=Aphanomyces stellatus TaxID=120398 RepID=A0A485L4G3_9STRA|nr:hypothetical protein As57867_015521 [Aphanomyces stellatus]VFT92379.1 Aste57867_15577 [Aphanomyces stellatus]